MSTLFLLVAVLLNAVANFCVKLGSAQLTGGVRAVLNQPQLLFSNGYLIVGIACFVVALFFYAFALARFPLSVAYPIMVGAGFLIVTFFAVWYLQEPLGWLQVLGMIFIVLGVILLSQHGALLR